jgi:AraC-like DNA-binding protein
MYSYLFFGLFILGLFSIIENIKGRQKLTLIKLIFIVYLSCISINSLLDFFTETGHDFTLHSTIIRLFSTIITVNIFYLVAANKVPKIVLYIEAFFFLIYCIAIIYGFRFIVVYKGHYSILMPLFVKFNYYVTNPLILGSMLYNVIRMRKVSDLSNQYQIRIRNWTIFLTLFFIVIFITVAIPSILYYKNIASNYMDTRSIIITYRFILILFILFRPKFIDDAGFTFKINHIRKPIGQVSLQNFEFLFYSNQYFLQPDANLENFALRLNYTKSEVSEFIKKQTGDSFTELVNKNRINYFKEMLKSKQHESFTIEALSEMSGFNNRQSMYNAFKKYEGCSPSEYINNL